jgi:hypothetical protein
LSSLAQRISALERDARAQQERADRFEQMGEAEIAARISAYLEAHRRTGEHAAEATRIVELLTLAQCRMEGII